MSAFRDRLLVAYQEANSVQTARIFELEDQVKRLRRANAILALNRVTEEQIEETDRAIRRIVGLEH